MTVIGLNMPKPTQPAENRVHVHDYGIMSTNDPRLIVVPSSGLQRKLHWLAAESLARIRAACIADTGIDLLVASGHRPHRWKDRAEYEVYLIENYGSVEKGRVSVAFDSPHETGLCVDFGSGGLSPNSKTARKQKATLAYHWLCGHAHEHGFTSYLPEPWHWEYNCGKDKWSQGI